MEMQINVNTKIIYMDSAVPVMRAIENVKRERCAVILMKRAAI